MTSRGFAPLPPWASCRCWASLQVDRGWAEGRTIRLALRRAREVVHSSKNVNFVNLHKNKNLKIVFFFKWSLYIPEACCFCSRWHSSNCVHDAVRDEKGAIGMRWLLSPGVCHHLQIIKSLGKRATTLTVRSSIMLAVWIWRRRVGGSEGMMGWIVVRQRGSAVTRQTGLAQGSSQGWSGRTVVWKWTIKYLTSSCV